VAVLPLRVIRASVALPALLAIGCAGVPDAGAATATAVPERPVEIRLAARGGQFEPASVAVGPAPVIAVLFENADPGSGHALVLDAGPGTARLLDAPPTVGPDRATYVLRGLRPGAYRFTCRMHPAMAAELVVG